LRGVFELHHEIQLLVVASGELELALESLPFNGGQATGATSSEQDDPAVAPVTSIAGANSVRPGGHPLDGVTVLLEVLGPIADEAGR